jgi:TonB family protein
MDTMIRPIVKEGEKEDGTIVPMESYEVSELSAPPRKDPWIPVLTISIMGLTLLLGWMLGHRGLSRVVEKDKPPLTDPISAKPAAQANVIPPTTTAVPPVNNSAATTTIAKTPAATPGGLTVYENGKLVFQVKPVPARANSIAVEVSANAANSLLIERVEPQYPDSARLAHIQGPVILQVDVNEKGTVQQVRALNGDPQLVTAAVDAVKHWRFKPYAPRGEALNFQTQVTVDFKLP